jgi:hypothetical protein
MRKSYESDLVKQFDECPSNKGRFLIRYSYDTTRALRIFYDGFFSALETSVLLTTVEELFEDHVQPLIGKFRKWGCGADKQNV